MSRTWSIWCVNCSPSVTRWKDWDRWISKNCTANPFPSRPVRRATSYRQGRHHHWDVRHRNTLVRWARRPVPGRREVSSKDHWAPRRTIRRRRRIRHSSCRLRSLPPTAARDPAVRCHDPSRSKWYGWRWCRPNHLRSFRWTNPPLPHRLSGNQKWLPPSNNLPAL